MTTIGHDWPLRTAPAVFAVGDTYQIIAQASRTVLFQVQVGDEVFHDASNGVMNTLSDVHRVSVPMALLDAAGDYTVRLRPVVERRPYFTRTEDVIERRYAFRPVPRENARAYHLADCHNLVEEPVRAARAFGEIDFLILNGDVIDHSGRPENFDVIYRICAELTGGEIPVVFARGNHDLRGEYAEQFIRYAPHDRGSTYYTFRLGSIWGVILDCGEDKPDDHPEYGWTVACHAFRREQTRFLQDVIARAQTEYAAPGIDTRLVISHVPFAQKDPPPFDIEEDVYRQWCALLREHVRPHLMLSGHTHRLDVRYPGHERDDYGQPCPVVVGSARRGGKDLVGCGFVFGAEETECVFTDCEGNVVHRATITKCGQ